MPTEQPVHMASAGLNVYAATSHPQDPFNLAGYVHHQGRRSAARELMLADVVAAVDEARHTLDKRHHLDIIKGLVDIADAGDNPVLDRMVILRLLLPHKDRHAVYGMASRGILIQWSKVVSATAKSTLQQFVDHPPYSQARRGTAEASPDDDTEQPNTQVHDIACYPEQAVFAALSSMPEVRLRESCLTAREAASTCQRITQAYHDKERLMVSGEGLQTSIHADTVTQEMKELIQWITPAEARFMTIVLLRRVTHGVEPSTVWAAMHGDASRFVARNNDFLELARWSYEASHAAPSQGYAGVSEMLKVVRAPEITVGTPFIPMTCDVAKSPYLMQWLFASSTGSIEDGVTLLPLAQSRLIVLSGNRWFVPSAAGGSPLRNNFVEISEHPNASKKGSRIVYKDQLPILNGMRDAEMLDVQACNGLMISYVMTAGAVRYGQPRQGHMHITAAQVAAGADFDGKAELPDASECAEVPDDLSVLISKATNPLLSIDAAGAKAVATKRKPAAPERAPSKLIVQEKYDGDRLQAHVSEDGSVRLFTRNGKSVENVYTDVRTALESAFRMQQDQHTPKSCVIDGELILIDQTGAPAPWVSAKWKYDTGNPLAKRLKLAEVAAAAPPDAVLTLIFPDDVGAADDDPTTDVSILPASTALEAFGEADNQRWEARQLDAGLSLQFVVFDVLWFAGQPVHQKPYAQRLGLLKSLPALRSQATSSAFRVVPSSREISTSKELVGLLQECIERQREGLILKDPNAGYDFRRTVRVQKVKLKSQDINCVVLGGGFRLTGNPRMVCLIAGICDDSRQSVLAYCRTEHFVGDHPSQVIQHLVSSPSLVYASKIAQALKQQQSIELPAGAYTLRAEQPSKDLKHVVLRWDPVNESAKSDSTGELLRSHTVHYWQGLPDDMQFVIAPSDCGFGLSVSGDLRPLTIGENVDHSVGCPVAAVPRFAVGRLEFDHVAPYTDYIDTPSTTRAKFEHGQIVQTCVRTALDAQIARLRRQPLSGQRLLLALRILYGLDNETLQWPQPKQVKFDGGGGKELAALLVKYELPPLQRAERNVLFSGATGKSQWTLYRRTPIRSVVTGLRKLRKRRQQLQRLQALKAANASPHLMRSTGRGMEDASDDSSDGSTDESTYSGDEFYGEPVIV